MSAPAVPVKTDMIPREAQVGCQTNLVDRTGLPEAISKQNSLPITRKDYSLIGLPLRPDAEESARIRLRSARKAAGSEGSCVSQVRAAPPPGNPTRFAGWKQPPRCAPVSWQQRPRQRGYNIAGPPALQTSVLNLGPKAARLYPEPPRTRIGRRRHPFRCVPVCQISILLSTALSEAEVARPDRLFDGHGLREIPRLVHVGPHNRGTVIGKEL